MTQILVPVSYHLRNFNKYAKLDMQAAKNGNLTLIGENAVGKTSRCSLMARLRRHRSTPPRIQKKCRKVPVPAIVVGTHGRLNRCCLAGGRAQ